MSGNPCPCRGCTTAYQAGRDDAEADLAVRMREARRQSYRDGYNAACKARALADWVYTGSITMNTTCGWPFHRDSNCQECEEWETKAAANLDQYLSELDERQKAQRAARAAKRKITPPTQSA